MNDSTKKEAFTSVSSAMMENIYTAASKMARTIAVARCMAPNEAEANKIEEQLLGIFHAMAAEIYRQDLPAVQADLAVAKARASAAMKEGN